MATSATATVAVPAPLEGPFNTPPSPHALQPTPATVSLVKSQVEALLLSSPSYHELPKKQRDEMTDNLVRIGAYAAECMRDMCWPVTTIPTPTGRSRQPTASAKRTACCICARLEVAETSPARKSFGNHDRGKPLSNVLCVDPIYLSNQVFT